MQSVLDRKLWQPSLTAVMLVKKSVTTIQSLPSISFTTLGPTCTTHLTH